MSIFSDYVRDIFRRIEKTPVRDNEFSNCQNSNSAESEKEEASERE